LKNLTKREYSSSTVYIWSWLAANFCSS